MRGIGFGNYAASGLPSFSPITLAPDLWLKGDGPFWADSGRTTTATTTAMAWDDISGHARHAIAPAAANRIKLRTDAIPGHTVGFFDGLDSYLFSSGLSWDFSVFTLFVRLIPTRARVSGVIASGAEYTYLNDTIYGIQWMDTANLGAGVGQTVTFQSGPSATKIRVDGTETDGSPRGAAITSSGVKLGNIMAGGPNPAQFSLAELVLCARVCSAGEIASMESYLTALTVGPVYPIASPLVAFHGNSITEGTNTTALDGYWGVAVRARSPQPYFFRYGFSGYTIANLIDDFSTVIGPLYSASRTHNILVMWEITNSLGTGSTDVQAISDLVTYCTAAKAQGWTIILLDCLDRQQAGLPANFTTYRASVNSTLSTQFSVATADSLVWAAGSGSVAAVADYLVKVSTITQLLDSTNQTYYDSSFTHPSSAGHALIGPPVASALGFAGA